MENQDSMKQRALTLAMVLAMGCGFGCSQAPEEMLAKQSASLQTAAPLCAPVELVAEKSYSPSSWADATAWLDTQRAFLLPGCNWGKPLVAKGAGATGLRRSDDVAKCQLCEGEFRC
ncbi:MAG: hypothetical protein SFV15_15045 [Polyangiaceae bacterium]|nr:hypothetical protein [Polyangiaceae bacterium]